MTELIFDELPAILPCYLRALVSGRSATRLTPADIPDSCASVTSLVVDSDRLERFRTLLGYPDDGTLPPTFPQVLAAPLHLSLLTAREFPLRATGLVHLSNSIRCLKKIQASRPLHLVAAVSNPETTATGIEFTLETSVTVDGQCCWQASSLLLARSSGGRSRPRINVRRAGAAMTQVDRWQADSDIGRRYAAVSGDYNPIHLHGLTARVFGFRAPIAHGMWSLGRAMAALHEQLSPAAEIKADFLRPILLPASLRLMQDHNDPIGFSVVDDATNKAYLTGTFA